MKAKGIKWYEQLAPMDFDTTLGNTDLCNSKAFYYIEPLGKIARGSEINYVGQGMLYNRLPGWIKADRHIALPLHKIWGMTVELVYGQVGYRPYAMPNRNEKWFTNYGFEHYKK
jgi:hypothetical protein